MSYSLAQLSRTRHQLRRLTPILRVLVRHGFGHYVQRFSLHHFLHIPFGKPGVPVDTFTAPQRFRMVLEDLGPTFIKFGQMLSTRADLLPERYLEELRKLTEHVPPFPTAEARRLIEEELGRPVEELFAEFAAEPVASGSIGQVYHATLHTGELVVVKVRRPGIEQLVLADLDLLEFGAPLADRVEEFKPLRLPLILDEFRRSVLREMDFTTEASFTAKIGEHLADMPYARVPRVYWELTTSGVLVLERLIGPSLNARAELARMPVDRPLLARRLAEIFLHQFFKTGLFHADPHGGNILVLEGNVIGLVDFGMCGRLSTELRRHLSTSLIALSRRDLDIITDVYLEIGVLSEDTNIEQLKSDLQDALDKYYGIPIKRLDMRRSFHDAMRLARAHGVLLPRDFVLLSKSFVTMVMMTRDLDPEFDISQVVRPYALSLMMSKLSPKRVAHDAMRQLWYSAQVLRELPRDLRALTRKALGGSLQLTLRVTQLDGFVRELDRATNRLAFSVIVGAIVIGSSVLLHAKVPPYMEWILPGWAGRLFAGSMPQLSALGLMGFLFAGVLGMLLAVAIWRSGRM